MGEGMRLPSHAAHCRIIVAIIVSLLLGAVMPSSQPVHAAPPWLDYVNSLRANANLPPVTENPTWSAGDLAHAQYMVLNNTIGHSETAGNPGYSDAGNQAAMNGNVAVSAGSTTYIYQNAIDSWMTGPFHGIGIVDPTLAQTGFGIYTDFTIPFPAENAGAALDVLRGLTAPPAYPVFFPGNNKQMPYKSYDGNEGPDPLTSCAGYTAPTGPPLMLLFATTPTVNSATLTRDGTPGNLALCEFDETNYMNPDSTQQDLGRGVLAQRHGVIIMPQLVFTDGTYHLTVNNGGTISTITFGVGAAPPTLQSITVTPANSALPIGGTAQFTATGIFSDNSTQNLTGAVTWASTAPGIATITAGGLATMVSAGSSTITATSGAIVGSTKLSVQVNPLPGAKPPGAPDAQAPGALPLVRPGGSLGGVPNPLPAPRP
jgi:hypothetical protein